MGTFNTAVKNLNLLDAARPFAIPAPRWLKSLRLKEWQAFQIDTPDWFFCVAVYDTKSLGTAVIMAFEKTAQKLHVYERKAPSWQLQVARGLGHSSTNYNGRGLSIEIDNRLDDDRITLRFTAQAQAESPSLAGEFVAAHTTEPMVILQPFGPNRPLYSHKALMPARGTLRVNDHTEQYDASQMVMIVDDHKGYYPAVMQYDWVTGLGHDAAGQPIGFNLTDNQVTDHERFNENCLWRDGHMVPLPPIEVARPEGVTGTWEIRDAYGLVDLRFRPIDSYRNYLNAGIAKVDYHGPTGRFEGTIKTTAGEVSRFDGLYGMGEQKYIRL